MLVAGQSGCPCSCGWPVDWVGPLWLGGCLWRLWISHCVVHRVWVFVWSGWFDL